MRGSEETSQRMHDVTGAFILMKQ
ncbi:hypothetical protein LINPERHAP1_LOCUS30576 [Linum perenne]